MTESKPTLLVVEDDDRLRHLVCEAAVRSKAFASICDEHDGQAALAFIQERLLNDPAKLPDLILSDISMPRMDGLQFLRELKSNPETASIPVAIMTSSNRPNDRADAEEAGCCAFFDKPVRFDDYVKIVEALPGLCGTRVK